MNFCNHLNAFLAATVLAVMIAVTSSKSLTINRERRAIVQMCSPHMACAWAICPYRTISYNSPAFFPEEEDCIYIENKSCRCASRCQRTDLFEPGRANIKFEYRCMSPEVTRDIFPMSWRRRLASNPDN